MKLWEIFALVWIAATIAATNSGCGSAAQGALLAPTTPQQVSITIDASDGGAVNIGGDVWLDARGGSASSENDQQGNEITADVPISVPVNVSAAGANP